jgi:CrcB protein
VTLLLVMIVGALGAPSRWLLDQKIQGAHDSVFPWGTFNINVTGSLLLGIILGTVELGPGTAQLAAIAGTGFCGGFTTFSTFGPRLPWAGSCRTCPVSASVTAPKPA